MNPRHLKQVHNDRKAVAPYNFVELPNKIVEAELECNGKLRDNDRYYPDRRTGKIQCTLRTESPLYIRCGLTPTDFSNFGDLTNEKLTDEQRKKKAEFFHSPSNSLPVLPGSSLRGMLRTLVEIISFGKIGQVSDQQKFFFRAVAVDSDDPLSQPYKDQMKSVRAGYLVEKQGSWYIRPVSETVNGKADVSFVWVNEKQELRAQTNQFSPRFIALDELDYLPQYKQVSFETTYLKNGRTLARNVSPDTGIYHYKGVLVTSGNMKQEGNNAASPRRNHCIVLAEDKDVTELLKIDDIAVKDYRDALTNFQQENPFKKIMGVLQNGRPIFYCQPLTRKPVTLFGQSPNFRIPYSPNNDGRAASAVNFIPKAVGESDKIDLADAIFGFVRRGKDKKEQNSADKSKEKREQSRAGRIFITDAHYIAHEDDIDLNLDRPPQILATPKPTTFQNYLVQPEETKAVKSELKHYGKPVTETVIRGHKLYWHKGNVSKKGIQTDATEAEIKKKQSQYTEIKPIKAGVTFEFTIQFENLSDVELGALLCVLTLANHDLNKLQLLGLDGKEKYCLSLGMGKPLGMGAITIEKSELILDERSQNQGRQRYTQLFDGDSWLTSDRLATFNEYNSYVEAFERYIIEQVDELDLPEGCTDRNVLRLKDIPRIRMLLAMLSWDFPPVNETRYMEIERDINKGYRGKQVKQNEKTKDEYEDRLVLPTPLQIKGWEDKRRIDNLPASPSTGGTNNNPEGSKP